jgi:hypothetical protein
MNALRFAWIWRSILLTLELLGSWKLQRGFVGMLENQGTVI